MVRENLPEKEQSEVQPASTGEVEKAGQETGGDVRELLTLPKGVSVRHLDDLDDPEQRQIGRAHV